MFFGFGEKDASIVKQIVDNFRSAIQGYLAFIIGVSLGIIALLTGYIGWSNEGVEGVATRLYLALLSFGGDPIYVTGLPEAQKLHNPLLLWARTLGAATAAIAVGAIFWTLLSRSVAQIKAMRRKGHAVLIGPSIFGMERLRRSAPGLPITVLGTSDVPTGLGRSALHVDVSLDDAASLRVLVGRPSVILFGARETVRNIARARALLPELGKLDDVYLRIEDITLVRDLAQLAPELEKVTPVSSSETIAEAVVFATSPPEIAALRGQAGVHIVLIGLGATNLALAEQLAAICFHPAPANRDRLRLTVLDCDIEAARARLLAQSPGLKHVARIQYRQLDGLECRRGACLRTLRAIERLQPVTLVSVATGDDARNASIGMRLRQVQLENLVFRAPILVRNHVRVGLAPPPLSDISAGLYDFGGDSASGIDPIFESFEKELAEQMHDRWFETETTAWRGARRASPPVSWSGLSSAEQRSSILAARAAPNMLRASGLVPDPGSQAANMHVQAGAVGVLRGRRDVLKQLEHERWIAEKLLDGYVVPPANGPRDDERRYHPALVPWHDLDLSDQEKDAANVDLLINYCRDRKPAGTNRWRWRWRVGLIGPLSTKMSDVERLEGTFSQYLAQWTEAEPAWPASLEATSLEILTPDAPGFDRVAACALARAWSSATKRKCRITALRAARPQLLDAMALKHLVRNTPEDALEEERSSWRGEFRAQATGLAAAGGGFLRTADLRPGGYSDADLSGPGASATCASLFTQSTLRVAEHIDALSDLLVWASTDEEGAQSIKIGRARAKAKRPTFEINL